MEDPGSVTIKERSLSQEEQETSPNKNHLITIIAKAYEVIILLKACDKHHYTDFSWVQCNAPTTLALGSLRCFIVISSKFAVVISTASSYIFKCKSHTGWSRACSLVIQTMLLFVNRKVHNFQK